MGPDEDIGAAEELAETPEAIEKPVGDITTGREPAYLGRVSFLSSLKVIKQMKAQGL